MFNLARQDDLLRLVPRQFWGLCSKKPISVFRNDIDYQAFPLRKDDMLRLLEHPVLPPTPLISMSTACFILGSILPLWPGKCILALRETLS